MSQSSHWAALPVALSCAGIEKALASPSFTVVAAETVRMLRVVRSIDPSPDGVPSATPRDEIWVLGTQAIWTSIVT